MDDWHQCLDIVTVIEVFDIRYSNRIGNWHCVGPKALPDSEVLYIMVTHGVSPTWLFWQSWRLAMVTNGLPIKHSFLITFTKSYSMHSSWSPGSRVSAGEPCCIVKTHLFQSCCNAHSQPHATSPFRQKGKSTNRRPRRDRCFYIPQHLCAKFCGLSGTTTWILRLWIAEKLKSP